jgi:hypothetical protein
MTNKEWNLDDSGTGLFFDLGDVVQYREVGKWVGVVVAATTSSIIVEWRKNSGDIRSRRSVYNKASAKHRLKNISCITAPEPTYNAVPVNELEFPFMPESQYVVLPDLVKANFANIEQRFLSSCLTSNGLSTHSIKTKAYPDAFAINIDDLTGEEGEVMSRRIAEAMRASDWNKSAVKNAKNAAYGDLKITVRERPTFGGAPFDVEDELLKNTITADTTIQDCAAKFPNASILLGDTCFSTEESARITKEAWKRLRGSWDEALELKDKKAVYSQCPYELYYSTPTGASKIFEDLYFNHHSKENSMSKTATAKIEERLYLREVRVDDASPETLLSFIDQLRSEINSLEEVLETTESKYVAAGISERARTIATLTELLDKQT